MKFLLFTCGYVSLFRGFGSIHPVSLLIPLFNEKISFPLNQGLLCTFYSYVPLFLQLDLYFSPNFFLSYSNFQFSNDFKTVFRIYEIFISLLNIKNHLKRYEEVKTDFWALNFQLNYFIVAKLQNENYWICVFKSDPLKKVEIQSTSINLLSICKTKVQ